MTPLPQAVSVARVFVRHQLISLRYADLIENAGQVTAELVGNAVNAVNGIKARGSGVIGSGERIRLRLGPNGGRPLLEVWDPSPSLPVMREPDPMSESGRGLRIVESLTAGFGWYETGGGKTVWALLR